MHFCKAQALKSAGRGCLQLEKALVLLSFALAAVPIGCNNPAYLRSALATRGTAPHIKQRHDSMPRPKRDARAGGGGGYAEAWAHGSYANSGATARGGGSDGEDDDGASTSAPAKLDIKLAMWVPCKGCDPGHVGHGRALESAAAMLAHAEFCCKVGREWRTVVGKTWCMGGGSRKSEMLQCC